MSFIPPGDAVGAETVRRREEELEARAERYAQTHPDQGDSSSSRGLLRRLIDLIRRPAR